MVLNNQNASSRERVREKDTKPSFAKKKFDDFKLAPKEKTAELRTKDSKIRTGKSYLEERQRQAERREEQRKKLSQNSSSATDTKLSTEDKTLENEEGMLEEKPSESGSKVKDSDFKRADRSYKRDEGRGSSFKYESKREREGEERRPRRANDRSYQSTKRDDERSEDTGRKRYSETRKNYDSPRERYKDKDKNKVSNLKKTPESTVEIDSTIEKLNKQPDTDILVNNEDNVECKDSADVLSEGKKTKQIELKDKVNSTRRKSFDYDKNRQSSYSSSKTNNKEKFSEKKRRNSFGSSKNKESLDVKTHHTRNTSDTEIKESFHDTSTEQSLKEESKLEKEIPHNEEHTEEDGLKKDFEIKDRSIPKRRNSTGERQSLEKLSSRRNSLGSEDKNMICTFDNEEHTCDSDISAKGKNKDDKNQQRNSRDPRTERRIRNKDRPSLEIYRPGMGKFSKQRLEREKGLGSSTEIESPSSSPSPTPIMKHKILSGSQH